jgi:hypothetical protein
MKELPLAGDDRGASLLYALGEAPPIVTTELGHSDPAHNGRKPVAGFG